MKIIRRGRLCGEIHEPILTLTRHMFQVGGKTHQRTKTWLEKFARRLVKNLDLGDSYHPKPEGFIFTRSEKFHQISHFLFKEVFQECIPTNVSSSKFLGTFFVSHFFAEKTQSNVRPFSTQEWDTMSCVMGNLCERGW